MSSHFLSMIEFLKGFKGRFFLIIFFGALIIGSMMYALIPEYVKKFNQKSFNESLLIIDAITKESISLFLEFEDYESIQTVFDKIGENKQVMIVSLMDKGTKTILSEYKNDGVDLGNISNEAILISPLEFQVGEKEYILNVGLDNITQVRLNEQIRRFIFQLVSIAIIVITVLMLLLITFLTKPLSVAIAALKNVADGDGDLTRKLDDTQKDEFGQLAYFFNLYQDSILNIVTQVRNISDTLKESSESISASSGQMASGAEHQQEQLKEVATSIEEMSTMILEANKNTSETKENANLAKTAAENGHKTVELTINGMAEIAEIVQVASDQISGLENRSDEIGQVIQVIDEIADQTNLLALNANIEAARAGEAGRGFAVVADEVRKLAERTVQATSDVGDKIQQIQNEIASAVDAMNKITTETGNGREIAGQSGEALTSIVSAIGNVDDAVGQIAFGADEQSNRVEEISKNVENVSTVSKQAASSAQDMASSTHQLQSDVEGLNTLVGKFKIA